MKVRPLEMVLLGVLGVACGKSEAHDADGAAGSGAAQSGMGGQVAANGGSASPGAGGSSAGSAGAAVIGRGGAAGSMSVGAGTAGTAGMPALGGTGGAGGGASGQGGASAGAPMGGSDSTSAGGLLGDAGDTGAAGAGGAGGGLAVGEYELDLQVIYQDKSAHIVSCAPDLGRVTMYESDDGSRSGSVTCQPELGASLSVNSLEISFYSTAVGQHDASELTITCDDATGACAGARVGVVFGVGGGGYVYMDSVGATSKTGTFTLDEFTAEGRVAGSLDVTMSQGDYEVTMKGHFAAHLNDCGPAGMTTQNPACVFPHN